jgi:hypothetical protein
MPVIPALKRLKHKFEDSLGCHSKTRSQKKQKQIIMIINLQAPNNIALKQTKTFLAKGKLSKLQGKNDKSTWVW